MQCCAQHVQVRGGGEHMTVVFQTRTVGTLPHKACTEQNVELPPGLLENQQKQCNGQASTQS